MTPADLAALQAAELDAVEKAAREYLDASESLQAVGDGASFHATRAAMLRFRRMTQPGLVLRLVQQARAAQAAPT